MSSLLPDWVFREFSPVGVDWASSLSHEIATASANVDTTGVRGC